MTARNASLGLACALLLTWPLALKSQTPSGSTARAGDVPPSASMQDDRSRLVLARRVVRDMNGEAGPRAMLASTREQSVTTMRGQLEGVTAIKRSRIIAAYVEASREAEDRYFERFSEEFARYLSSKVLQADLDALLLFIHSPAGQKTYVTHEPLTLTERQTLGRFAQQNPGIFTTLATLARFPVDRADFVKSEGAAARQDVQLSFCRKLLDLRAAVPACGKK